MPKQMDLTAMPLKTPQFWYDDRSVWPSLLSPLSACYDLARNCHTSYRNKVTKPYISSVPVICAGNIVAGGSGKTPTVIAIAKHAVEHGIAKNPVFLSRGYPGRLRGPILVDPKHHIAADVGDEALLLSRHQPTIIAHDRAQGARLAEEHKHDLIIMDDGLQNFSLHQDCKILVVDGHRRFGNGKLLPAGPLRQSLQTIQDQLHGVIIIENEPSTLSHPLVKGIAEFKATLQPTSSKDLKGNYVAFAGLAYPRKFYDTLQELGVALKGWHDFPDHYPYSKGDLRKLQAEAKKQEAKLITTEKDFVRIPEEFRSSVETLPVSLALDSPGTLTPFLKNVIDEKAAS